MRGCIVVQAAAQVIISVSHFLCRIIKTDPDVESKQCIKIYFFCHILEPTKQDLQSLDYGVWLEVVGFFSFFTTVTVSLLVTAS